MLQTPPCSTAQGASAKSRCSPGTPGRLTPQGTQPSQQAACGFSWRLMTSSRPSKARSSTSASSPASRIPSRGRWLRTATARTFGDIGWRILARRTRGASSSTRRGRRFPGTTGCAAFGGPSTVRSVTLGWRPSRSTRRGLGRTPNPSDSRRSRWLECGIPWSSGWRFPTPASRRCAWPRPRMTRRFSS